MTGEDVAAVLDAELTLDETLHEVAPCAEDDDNEGKAYPAKQGHGVGLPAPDDEGCGKGEESAADAAYPRLLGRDARKELEGD